MTDRENAKLQLVCAILQSPIAESLIAPQGISFGDTDKVYKFLGVDIPNDPGEAVVAHHKVIAAVLDMQADAILDRVGIF